MKSTLIAAFVLFGLAGQAQAAYMLSTVCLDTKGGAYLAERTVCYDRPNCVEVSTPLTCMNSNCTNPKIDLTQLDPRGPAGKIGGTAMLKLMNDLAFMTMKSSEDVATSPVFGIADDPETTLICAPAMPSNEFDAKGIEAKLSSH